MSKIGAAVLQISRHLGIGHAQVAVGHAQGKNEKKNFEILQMAQFAKLTG